MRRPELDAERLWLLIVAVLTSILASQAILALPSVGLQAAMVAAVGLGLLWLVMARNRRFLDPAWVFVLSIYLLDAGGIALQAAGSPVPMVIVASLAPLPFAVTSLFAHPERAWRLAWLAPLLGLAILGGLSLGWSADPGYGGRKLIQWLITGVAPAAAVLALASVTRPAGWRIVAGAAFTYAVVLLAIGTTTLYPGRLVFFEANPIWVARACDIGALVVLFGPVPWRAKVVLLPPMLLAGYRTDSLGPTVGLVIGIALGVAEAIRTAPISRRRVWLSIGVLGAGTAFAVTLAVGAISLAPSAALAPIVDDPNITSRAEYLDIASRMFAGAPILGTGLGSFAAAGAADLYPHNLVAEVASELGVVGLALLAGWLALAIRGALRSPLLVALVAASSVFALF
ncbi:MAG: O-antigen ligase family protein, partial [Candidatus Limnocylindrales bacterium]